MDASSWPMKAPKQTVAMASHQLFGASRIRRGRGRSVVNAMVQAWVRGRGTAASEKSAKWSGE
jgi:hypothetical protein